MMVKACRTGRKLSGVEVGAINVRRYFPRGAAEVELLLDHLHIQCDLSPNFWQGDTGIRDPRLSAWLESKNFNSRAGAPVSLALIPTGKNCFRLQLLAPGHARLCIKPDPGPDKGA